MEWTTHIQYLFLKAKIPFKLNLSIVVGECVSCSTGTNLSYSIKYCQNDPITVERDCFLFPWPQNDNFNISLITYIEQVTTAHSTKLCNLYLQCVTETSKESLHNVSVTSPYVFYFCVLKYRMYRKSFVIKRCELKVCLYHD